MFVDVFVKHEILELWYKKKKKNIFNKRHLKIINFGEKKKSKTKLLNTTAVIAELRVNVTINYGF